MKSRRPKADAQHNRPTAMSLEVCILASGSSGNATVLGTPTGVMLIDAGIGPRTTAKRLEGTGVSLADVRANCLTHLDRDHFSPTWLATVVKQRIRVFCHGRRMKTLLGCAARGNRRRALVACFALLVHAIDQRPFEPIQGVKVRSIPLPHDEHGSHGFLVEGFACRVGYATDLGAVPEELMEHFAGVDVLALESNYDPEMELSTSRPLYVKQRIMGGRGHPGSMP